MNATRNDSNSTRPTNPHALAYGAAAALIRSCDTLLRGIGHVDHGNDSVGCVLADLARIGSVLSGRAVNGATGPDPDATYAAMSAPITMPAFARPETTLPTNGASKAKQAPAPVAVAPIDPPTIESPVVCAKCNGKGTWRFGRPCPDCVPQIEPDAVVVAANKPVEAPALTTDDTDDVPVIGYDDVPEGYTITVQQPVMRNGKPLHVVEYDDEQLYDDYSPTKALAFAQKHAIDNGRARRAAKPAPTTMSQKPAAQPMLRQGNSSAPLDAPAPATKSNVKAAPSPAKPAGKATPVEHAPKPVAPPANVSNGVNADHVNRATEALDKGSLKALALACAVIGLPCRASDGATKMREALADWLLANDDADEQGIEPVAAVAPVKPTATDPMRSGERALGGNPAPKPAPAKAPAVKPAAAPKTVDTSSTGGLPINQWRMLLILDDSNVAMTYKQIDEVCQGEFGTTYYSGMTAALRDGKPDSLSDRGLVSESLIEVDGRSKFAFTITGEGKALVAKHS